MEYSLITLRELIGGMLIEEKNKHPQICVLDSDLAKSTTTNKFQDVYPRDFYELGIAEQNAMSVATGMTAEGKIPFYVNFAIFVSGTCWTQLRQACYAKANVKIIATHPGVDGSFDGATHHALEDIALMRVLPNLTILSPSCPEELKEAISMACELNGPVYIRCARSEVPNLPMHGRREIGKADIVEDLGNDFAFIYEGSSADLARRSFKQAKQLGLKGKLINAFSLKPFDVRTVEEIAESVKIIVTIENHSTVAGLGGLVCETVCGMNKHAPVKKVGVEDTFTESGSIKALKEKYGLSVERVIALLKD